MIKQRSKEIADDLASILSFDIEEMNEYNKNVEQVYRFIEAMRKEKDTEEFIDEIQYDNFKELEGKLKYKFKNQDYLNVLYTKDTK